MNFIGHLEMRCRPLICPFKDLLNYLPNNVSSFDVGRGTGYWLSLLATEKRPSALGVAIIYRRDHPNGSRTRA